MPMVAGRLVGSIVTLNENTGSQIQKSFHFGSKK